MLLAEQRRWSEAEGAFGRAISLATNIPYPYSEARSLHESGQMFVRLGRLERAKRQLSEALAMYKHLGARPYVERTEQALQEIP